MKVAPQAFQNSTYNTISSAHIQLKHAGRNNLQNYFRDKYANITKDCIMTFLSLCKSCPRKKRIHEPNVKKEAIRLGDMLASVPNAGLIGEDEVDVDVDDEGDDGIMDSTDQLVSPNGTSSMLGLSLNFNMPFMKHAKRERISGEADSFTRGQVSSGGARG